MAVFVSVKFRHRGVTSEELQQVSYKAKCDMVQDLVLQNNGVTKRIAILCHLETLEMHQLL